MTKRHFFFTKANIIFLNFFRKDASPLSGKINEPPSERITVFMLASQADQRDARQNQRNACPFQFVHLFLQKPHGKETDPYIRKRHEGVEDGQITATKGRNEEDSTDGVEEDASDEVFVEDDGAQIEGYPAGCFLQQDRAKRTD